MKKYNPLWLPDQKCFYIYNNGYYKSFHVDNVKQFAQKHYDYPVCTIPREREVFLEFVKNNCPITTKTDLLAVDNCGLVNFKNGVFDMNENVFKNSSHKYRFLSVLPYDFPVDTETLNTPIFDSLMDAVFMNNDHDKKLFLQFIGFILSGYHYDKHNCALILDGEGSNGKSTLIRLVKEIVGNDNYAAMSMHEMTKQNGRFHKVHLVGNLVNFCNEEPREVFSESGIFKQLTGGDPIFADDKGVKGFMFINRAKFILSTNDLLFIRDSSLGMRRRLIIIRCEQNFEKNPKAKIKNPIERIIKNKTF